ncbi:hypothetical protein EVAR_7794_1 [Eumeta japonica]|uniref:Uncharacterized protein n=1 Tax=Eumeta variegata TaxID=151549 RepID=A0A4C1TJ35_EUMVA|nr:hypothetical protein EVAR_7794_1 [Eumeta japonica]
MEQPYDWMNVVTGPDYPPFNGSRLQRKHDRRGRDPVTERRLIYAANRKVDTLLCHLVGSYNKEDGTKTYMEKYIYMPIFMVIGQTVLEFSDTIYRLLLFVAVNVK